MKSISLRFPWILLLVLAVAACGGRHQMPAQLAPDVQFQRGMEAYEAGRFGRAIEFLQPFSLSGIGDPRLPDGLYALARSYFERREYVAAATEYLRLATEFPNHPRALEGRLGACEAYSRLAPGPQLDQEFTLSALTHCASLAGAFPGTPEAERAQELMVEARHRLAEKAYQTGLFYFRRRAYDASVIYFQEAANQYPETTIAPAALLRMHEAYSRIGYVEEAQEIRERLLREYPDSSEAQELRA
jgi:outer membrane protein assembly factor BamD